MTIRRSALALLLVLLSVLPAAAFSQDTPALRGFEGTFWGATPDDVTKSMGSAGKDGMLSGLALQKTYERDFNGMPGTTGFVFMDNACWKISHSVVVTSTENVTRLRLMFGRIVEQLRAKNGAPARQENTGAETLFAWRDDVSDISVRLLVGNLEGAKAQLITEAYSIREAKKIVDRMRSLLGGALPPQGAGK